jgi:hypothetical protein
MKYPKTTLQNPLGEIKWFWANVRVSINFFLNPTRFPNIDFLTGQARNTNPWDHATNKSKSMRFEWRRR